MRAICTFCLSIFMVLSVAAGVLAQVELGDAEARLQQTHRDSELPGLRRVAEYTGARAARLGLVENDAGHLWVIARSRTRSGERIDVAQVTQAVSNSGRVRVVSQAHRLFAVEYMQVPRPPETHPCACSSPGGLRGVQWFRIDDDASVHRVLEYDSSIGSAEYDEAARIATVVQRRGPVRCPAHCTPAPAIQIIYTRKHQFRRGRFHQVSETSERVYTG